MTNPICQAKADPELKQQGVPPAQMKVACAWCGCDLGWIEANPHYANRTKQGICATCRTAYHTGPAPS